MAEQRRRAGDDMSIETKVGLIEVETKTLSETQKSMEERFNTRFTHLEAAVDSGFQRIFERLEDRGRANWPLFISAMGLILGTLWVILTMSVAPLNSRIEFILQGMDSHMDGHPHNVRSEVRALRDKHETEMESQHREFTSIINFLKDDIDRLEHKHYRP